MADDRRRFMEEAIRACDEKRRGQLLDRLEEVEDTGPQDKVPVLVKGDGTAVFFAKLAFQDETGAWRYGLFDPTGCEVTPEGAAPTAEPILVSKRNWRRLHYDPRGIDPDKRRRTGH